MQIPANVASFAKTLWWIVLLRGILMAIFGVVMIAWPTAAILAFVLIFGIYALLDGIATFASVLRTKSNVGLGILVGIISIAAGIIALVWPATTATALLYVVAVWAVVLGLVEVAAGLGARTLAGSGSAWIVGSGVLTVALGIVLFVNPGDGIIAMSVVVGVFTLFAGLALIVSAFIARGRVTRFAETLGPQDPQW